MSKMSFLYGLGVGMILSSTLFFIIIQYNKNYQIREENIIRQQIEQKEINENSGDIINSENIDIDNAENEKIGNDAVNSD